MHTARKHSSTAEARLLATAPPPAGPAPPRWQTPFCYSSVSQVPRWVQPRGFPRVAFAREVANERG